MGERPIRVKSQADSDSYFVTAKANHLLVFHRACAVTKRALGKRQGPQKRRRYKGLPIFH